MGLLFWQAGYQGMVVWDARGENWWGKVDTGGGISPETLYVFIPTMNTL